MSIETATAENFFVVRWGKPAPEDFDRIVREVTDLREQTGKDILYLGIMPDDMPMVDQRDSKRFMKLIEDVLPMCSMLCVAMEMRGFRAAIIRSAMAAVTMLTRRHDKLRFVDSTATALDACEAFHLADKTAMGRAIEQTGANTPAGFAA